MRDVRYGYIALSDDDAVALAAGFSEDPVGEMILRKVYALKEACDQPPYIIELMISV